MGNEKRKLLKYAYQEKNRTISSVQRKECLEKIEQMRKDAAPIPSLEVKMQIIQDLRRLEKMIEFTGVNKSVEEKIENMSARISRARER